MRRKRKAGLILVGCILAAAAALAGYFMTYYHADEKALQALGSDEAVLVEKTEYGWHFDGPGEESVLIFYPGAKVEETAYAPLLHLLAGEGMDACLVRMPLRIALLGMDQAGKVIREGGYRKYYIGGHSLGGAAAAMYAGKNAEGLDGIVLLAAYPTGPLPDRFRAISIYGSEDGVLNRKRLEEGRQYLPGKAKEQVIAGGNHAGFGNYGPQKGDGLPKVDAAVQQKQTAEAILSWLQEP